ncbi:MAG: LytTR family DNA-binding domain-containing protein [Lachnospiraceae bacterium]|nr:LytTR family DNA-binding domain-containing protein [Lachnospiraceae bacterium]
MKKILVLEDNHGILDQLTDIVREIDIKNTVYPFDNVKDAYQCAMEKVINLFIIDIILDTSSPGDSSGLGFVENIRKISHYGLVPVIFVTSLEDARLYTYENLHCYSFIEKPFDENRLKQMIEQCLYFSASKNVIKTLYFRKDGIILAVEREDIVYVESINHILHIHTRQKDTMTIPYITLKRILEDIDSNDFIQCSRSAIVNKKFISNIDIPNRIIQLKKDYGSVEIGISFKKTIRDI